MATKSTTTKSPNRLSVTKEQLAEAGRTVGLGSVQTDRMWEQLITGASAPTSSAFSAAQVAWYFGAAIVLVAMGWLIAVVGMQYGNNALIGMSVAYAALFTYGGWNLASQRDQRIPGGLLYALAVGMTPVAVAAGMDAFHTGFTSSAQIAMPLVATSVVGLVYMYLTRSAQVMLPTLLAAWGAVYPLADSIAPGTSWEALTIGYGVTVLAGTFVLGRTSSEGEDFSFWGYSLGALATYIGMTFLSKGEFGYIVYAAFGILAMLVSVLVSRRVLAVAGAAAVLTWLGHLSVVFFANSTLFPLALTAIGVATIYGGVLYQRNSERIEAAILRIFKR